MCVWSALRSTPFSDCGNGERRSACRWLELYSWRLSTELGCDVQVDDGQARSTKVDRSASYTLWLHRIAYNVVCVYTLSSVRKWRKRWTVLCYTNQYHHRLTSNSYIVTIKTDNSKLVNIKTFHIQSIVKLFNAAPGNRLYIYIGQRSRWRFFNMHVYPWQSVVRRIFSVLASLVIFRVA